MTSVYNDLFTSSQDIQASSLKYALFLVYRKLHTFKHTSHLHFQDMLSVLLLVTLVSSEKMWFAGFNLNYFEIRMEPGNLTKLITMVGHNSSLELTAYPDYFRLIISDSDYYAMSSIKRNYMGSLIFERKFDLFTINRDNFTTFFSDGDIKSLNFTDLAVYAFSNK